MPEGIIDEKQSEDEEVYRVLRTPGEVEFSDVSYAGFDDVGDGYSFHHVYVKAEQIRNQCLPLDANPREPTRSDVVTKMSETLRDFPQRFHHWNNGITLICDNFFHDKKASKITVTFEQGDGICNGGHTYFSIVTYPANLPDSCYAHLEFIKLPAGLLEQDRKRVINDIASRRNRNKQLRPSTQADYLGYYQPFQSALGEFSNHISWHEGDSEAQPEHIPSELYIRMLAALDPLWFKTQTYSTTKPTHKRAATSPATIHKNWFDGMDEDDPAFNLRHMAFLGKDILLLSDVISYSLTVDDFGPISPRWRGRNFAQWICRDTRHLKIHSPGIEAVNLPPTALVMLLGAFRSNIWLNFDPSGNIISVGFFNEPVELWDKGKYELLRRLTNLFADNENDPNKFCKNNAPYDYQLIDIIYGMMPPNMPCRFFMLKTGEQFIRDDANPTHFLEPTGNVRFSRLYDKSQRDIPKTALPYRRME